MRHVFQLPSGFRNLVDDNGDFMPVRKIQAGGVMAASCPASRSGMRCCIRACAAGEDNAPKLSGGKSCGDPTCDTKH